MSNAPSTIDPVAPRATETLRPAATSEPNPTSEPEASSEAAPPGKKPKKKGIIDTMFRVSFGEQLNLTALADTKANMMIQVNGLIISIMLASSGIILDSRPWLLLPCATLATTALLSILFAVLAARPKLNKSPRLTALDVHSGRANILFFGNFGRLTEDEFVTGMFEMFEDNERVHLNLTRHMYGLGLVLLHKFRLLRISYTVFLVGLLVSGGMFLVSVTVAGVGGK